MVLFFAVIDVSVGSLGLVVVVVVFLWAGSWVHKGAILSGKPTYYLLLKHVLTFIIKQ